MSRNLDSCSLNVLGGGGTFGARSGTNPSLLALESCYLQVGLIRNGSGNDHLVVAC